MSKIDLTKYGITDVTEIVHNPSYELLFEEETNPALEGYEKGQVTELDTVNVMTLYLCLFGGFGLCRGLSVGRCGFLFTGAGTQADYKREAECYKR